jgi:hypothetical protein
MINYEIHHIPSESAESIYEALDKNGQEIGALIYQPSEEENVIDLVFLRSTIHRAGIAKNLLRTFVQNLPEHIHLTSIVIHTETVEKIEVMGFLKQAKENGEITITDPTVLHSLPIVKVLSSGNIETTTLTITHVPQYENTEEFPYTIVWDGRPKSSF